MNAREQATNLFAIGAYYWLTGDERQAEEYWSLANRLWEGHWPLLSHLNQLMEFPS